MQNSYAAAILSALMAEGVSGDLQSFDPRGEGGVAVIEVGSTRWRVQIDPLACTPTDTSPIIVGDPVRQSRDKEVSP